MDEPVTTTEAYQVAPGRESDFCAWATAMLRETAKSTDYLGGGVLGPERTDGKWNIVYQWADRELPSLWASSATRARWLAAAAAFTRPTDSESMPNPRTRPAAPLPSGFRPPAPSAPPPKWKMAVITLAAVFPPVLVFNVALIPYLRDLSIVLRTLALCVAVTIVVTWVMMPRLMRLFRGWLHPSALRRGGLHRGAPTRRRTGPPGHHPVNRFTRT